ncbi:hypothetical protein R1sor_004403 [Riccia sorocarpa]|uniref:Reverse transcriptase domain-containing protein n=1 Tax=Riccia sorocarpa TaxID=122646 RepID=A0ABD3HGU3_9MARC
MNEAELNDPEVMQKTMTAWGQEFDPVRDDRRRWARGWFRVKQELKHVRKQKEQKKRQEGDLEAEVRLRREELNANSREADHSSLINAERRLKERELSDAREWKLRSRERWLSVDDAPSKYFFTKLKANWANESMETLTLDSGESTDDQEEILEGHDGLTIQVVQKCWELVGDSCVKMLQAVWAKKGILKADCLAIIKLIHKGDDKKKLANWRPISLMTLTYKIVSKILANWVRERIPDLVDSQQSGFIKGRQIADNILSFKTAQEWAAWMELKGIFVKIDFVKAYDRVDHTFLWMVLEKMGFDSHFINLVKGFTCSGAAKVHINGAMTKEIQVGRGVRQGCPLAPYCDQMVPDWVHEEGCAVAEEGRPFRYLGVQVGVNIQEFATVNEVIRRMQRRMNSWENHYLSWTAQRARALQMRYATAILEDRQVEWVWICKRWIRFKLISGSFQRERRRWSCQDAMLLMEGLRLPEAPTVHRILQGWFTTKKILRCSKDAFELPRELTIGALKYIWRLQDKENSTVWPKIEEAARHQKVCQLKEIVNEDNSLNINLITPRKELQGSDLTSWGAIKEWLSLISTTDDALHRSPGWTWKEGSEVGSSWHNENRFWSSLIWQEAVSFEYLNRTWECTDSNDVWKRRWKLLWGGSSLLKHKVWVWRLIHEGLPTSKRAEKWGVSDGRCQICNEGQETVEHVVWGCRGIADRVSWFTKLLVGPFPAQIRFLELIDRILTLHDNSPGILMLFYECSWTSWKERNRVVFDGRTHRLSIRHIVEEWKWQIIGVVKNLEGRRGKIVKFNSEILLFQVAEAVELAEAC